MLRQHYWSNVLSILRQKVGAEVIVTSVPPTGSIASRAQTLDGLLRERASGKSINFIAHSMGGLDCRHLISHIKPTEYTPLSLTTIATPHRGSPFMDWCTVGPLDDVIAVYSFLCRITLVWASCVRKRLSFKLSRMKSWREPNSNYSGSPMDQTSRHFRSLPFLHPSLRSSFLSSTRLRTQISAQLTSIRCSIRTPRTTRRCAILASQGVSGA